MLLENNFINRFFFFLSGKCCNKIKFYQNRRKGKEKDVTSVEAEWMGSWDGHKSVK